MVEHENKSSGGVKDAEKTPRKQKVKEPVVEKLKAFGEVEPYSASLGNSMGESSQERHAALLANAKTEVQRANLAIHLQQTYGNRYMQRLVESLNIQAKLTVSQPDDEYEKEADRVADAVTSASTSDIQRQVEEEKEEEEVAAKPASDIQRQVEEPEEEGEEEVAAKPASEIQYQPFTVSEDLESRINTARSHGHPLSDSTRASLEPQFNRDFSEIKVHTDAEADNLSRQLNARAFTSGNDIFFRSGEYYPDSSEGRQLLAHELTHTIQQGTSTRIARWGGDVHETLTMSAAYDIIRDKQWNWVIPMIKKTCNTMDWRLRRIASAAGPYLKHLIGLGPIAGEGPEHGEDGNYTKPEATKPEDAKKYTDEQKENICAPENIGLQDERLAEAIAGKGRLAQMEKTKPKTIFGRIGMWWEKRSTRKEIAEKLGDALHIAQDRGSHREGARGLGHSNPQEIKSKGAWSTDNPSDNTIGYDKAKKNTREVLEKFNSG